MLSIIGTTTLSVTGTVEPNLLAYHAAFLAAAVLTLIAACIALAVSDKDAAVTMRRKSSAIESDEKPELVPSADAVQNGN